MGDATVFFHTVLFKLGILARLEPGQIVTLDWNGQWTLTKSCPYRSALRSVLGFLTRQNMQSQRSVFLGLATELVTVIQRFIHFAFRAPPLSKVLSAETGALSISLLRQEKYDVQEELEEVISFMAKLYIQLGKSNEGLNILKNNAPYKSDASFKTSLENNVQDPIMKLQKFLETRLGVDYKFKLENPNQIMIQRDTNINGKDKTATTTTVTPAVPLATITRNASFSTPPPKSMSFSVVDVKSRN